MCWSLCFVIVREAAQDHATDVARRIDRDAKKHHEELANSVIQSSSAVPDTTSSTVDSEEWKKNQLSRSFDKYWSSCHWAKSALLDFEEFAKVSSPRDPKMLSKEDSNELQLSSLRNAFEDSIFPALKNRGWVEQTPSANSKKKILMVGADGSIVSSCVFLQSRLRSNQNLTWSLFISILRLSKYWIVCRRCILN
jgi:hypothetical protein